jgi:arylsulfatase A
MDLFPTMATLGGAELPEGQVIDGVDLSPILFDSGELALRPLYWSTKKQGAIRYGEWKFVLDKKTGEEMLFNLKDDPFETRNVRPANVDKSASMKNTYLKWLADVTAGVEQQS